MAASAWMLAGVSSTTRMRGLAADGVVLVRAGTCMGRSIALQSFPRRPPSHGPALRGASSGSDPRALHVDAAPFHRHGRVPGSGAPLAALLVRSSVGSPARVGARRLEPRTPAARDDVLMIAHAAIHTTTRARSPTGTSRVRGRRRGSRSSVPSPSAPRGPGARTGTSPGCSEDRFGDLDPPGHAVRLQAARDVHRVAPDVVDELAGCR